MLALIEPGDEVIYPNPGFPIYESMIRFSGGVPVPIPLVEERGFSFDLDTLRKRLSPKTKLLILNSPQNPTGGVIPPEDIRAIADLVRDRDLMVLSDEIYSRIYYGDERPVVDREPARHAGKDHHPGRILEDLRHDRLAHGLRRDAGVAGGSGQQADGEFQLLHRELHAARRPRGADGPAGTGGTQWSRSSAAAAMPSARASTRSRDSAALFLAARSTRSPMSPAPA